MGKVIKGCKSKISLNKSISAYVLKSNLIIQDVGYYNGCLVWYIFNHVIMNVVYEACIQGSSALVLLGEFCIATSACPSVIVEIN